MHAGAIESLKKDRGRLPARDRLFAQSPMAQFAAKGDLSEAPWKWVGILADPIDTLDVPDFTKLKGAETVQVGALQPWLV